MVALFCILPFTTSAADVYILPPVVQWDTGYYGDNGLWHGTDYADYGVKTSPFVSVSPGTTYHARYTGVDFDTIRTYINEFDSGGNFLRRFANSQLTFDYVPSQNVATIRVTVRTYSSTTVNFTMYYDSESLVLPGGTEQIYDEVHYGGDGDFYTVGNEKALIYYKYLPDEDLKYIRIEAVNNYGKRLKFRVVGYVHGSEVFRSGLADFGENIDIQDANFDYYNIYLVNLDDDNESIPVEYIQSFRYIYGIKYYIYPPTEPPGISEEIYPTDYIDLNGLNWYIPTAPAPDSSITGALNLISSVNNRLFSSFPIYITAGAVAFMTWLLWLTSRRGD